MLNKEMVDMVKRENVLVFVSESVHTKGFTHTNSDRLLASNVSIQSVLATDEFPQVAYYS